MQSVMVVYWGYDRGAVCAGASGLEENALLRALSLAHGGIGRGFEQTVLDPNILSLLAGADSNQDFSALSGEAMIDPTLMRLFASNYS